MPLRSNDELVRQIRETRKKQIQECSERAAQKILASFPKSKIDAEALTEIISAEFDEINR
jgi:vacuolar-type H+-ATPase subunit H